MKNIAKLVLSILVVGVVALTGFSSVSALTLQEGAEAARKALRKATKPPENGDEYAIIYIEETMAKDILPEISKFQEKPSPAIILIPGKSGSLGLGEAGLKAAVERAVGADIS